MDDNQKRSESQAKTPSSILTGVLRLREVGLSTIPIKTDGSKAPAIPEWKPYQQRLPDERELREWFGNGLRPGVR
jgi:hypothetical protein